MFKFPVLYKKLFFWVTGLIAFLWFILRSGTNPRRLTYPCQQVAFPIASVFLISVVSVISGMFIIKRIKTISKFLLVILLLSLINISSVTKIDQMKKSGVIPTWVVIDPVSKVFLLDTIYKTKGSLAAGNNTVPDSNFDDPSMDSLFRICSSNGLNLYKNSSNPNGIVGSDDIVIIKPNFQWSFRLGTNTDRIKGLMSLILKHPDGFTGEIIICDNTQEYTDISEEICNSDDTLQSIIDVVKAFQAKGHPVFLYKWKNIRNVHVNEYSDGNYNDGYIIQKDKVTYPKFQSPSGKNYISLRYGIWDSIQGQYNHERLTIINFPVLKAHCMAGATVGIKNWVGVLSTGFTDSLYGGWDAMHYQYFWNDYALIARVMAVTAPKLTIVDASYTATKTNWQQPPSDNTVIKTNKLVASTDPLAASWYAAKFILTPIATYPDYTNPDNMSLSDSMHTYGCIIRRWAKFLIDSAHFPYTLDSTRISVFKTIGHDTGIINPPVSRIKRITKPDKLLIYPNPNKGQFTIEFPCKSDIAEIIIIAADGKHLLKTLIPVVNYKGKLSLSLKHGMYVVKAKIRKYEYIELVNILE
jgi:hypothetical protein